MTKDFSFSPKPTSAPTSPSARPQDIDRFVTQPAPQEDLVSFNARIPRTLKQEFDVFAARAGVKKQDLLATMIRSYLSQHPPSS